MPARPQTEVIPSARRLIQSLRDLGYDLATAIADLVDNSISAAATVVEIQMEFDGPDSWIRITDDGLGMSNAKLAEAMRFGTRRSYEDEDLGRFGLGLKAASLSQCRCLTVGSRTTHSGALRLACWDLDHVEQSDRWEIIHPRSTDVPLIQDALGSRAGTVVLWEDLDRIFRYRVPDGQRARADFDRVTAQVHEHLSMVFHRFLSGTGRRALPLSIILNGEAVRPWDPFAPEEPETRRLPVQKLRIVHDGRRYLVEVRPHVLPPEARFSSSAAHRRAAGPRFWNRQQGFYIYRADRLIQSGGWSRLRTLDEHSKLARISIDIPAGAEELFELNVSKTQVRIPGVLRAELSAIASSTARAAQEIYRAPLSAQSVGVGDFDVESDPRIQAITRIVQLVVTGTEELIRTELGRSRSGARLTAALRQMQSSFIRELASELLGHQAIERSAEGGAGLA